MLTKKQIKEIKEHLNNAQNPIFFFDNDQDGLCSFLLLRRYLGKGKGVPIKSFPDLTADFFRKVHEFKSDYIFILDKPVVAEDFFAEAEKYNLPVVWIDHHLVNIEKIPAFVNYYNPLFNRTKKEEPVTALCYQITEKKEDLWIAVAGCISDKFVPKFYSEFEKKYPDLIIKTKRKEKNAMDIYYKSQIGRVARIIGAGLKDRTTNVMKMIRFLIKVKSPYEVLEENSRNRSLHRRFKQIESKYRKLFTKAVSIGKSQRKMIFFQYGGDLSISADLSNELSYVFPEKIIVVVYIKGMKANISMRGKTSRKIFLDSIKDIEGARGGGHEDAIGGQMNVDDIEKFRENLKKILSLK